MILELFKNIISQKTQNIKYTWEGKAIHDYLKIKTTQIIEQQNMSYVKDQINKIICIDSSLLKYLIVENLICENYSIENKQIVKFKHGIKQYIQNLNREDILLLDESLKYKKPIEVMRLTINTTSHKKIMSKIFYGGYDSVSNQEQIQAWFHQHLFQTKQNGHSILSLEINHTHTSLEVSVTNNKGNLFMTNGLGKSDLSIAKLISEYFCYPLTISAIIPSGLKYRAIFR